MKLQPADVRALLVVVCLTALALFSGMDPAVVAAYLVGLTEQNPLDR